ncbi:MAG: hypothetical protein FJX66_13795 [Alphaproteobacteria bacterium]|nr:hypothetical protein [Alphaproteobacteria bacterium]
MTVLRRLIVAFAFLLMPGLALAAEPLTPKQVEGFIAVAPELEKLGTEHADEFDGESFQSLDAKTIVEALEAAGIAKDYEALVKKHGFTSSFEAADVMRRVMTAYMVSAGDGDPRVQLDEARAQVKSDDSLDEETRAGILKDIDATERAFADVDADKPVITPYIEQLREIFGGLVSGGE